MGRGCRAWGTNRAAQADRMVLALVPRSLAARFEAASDQRSAVRDEGRPQSEQACLALTKAVGGG